MISAILFACKKLINVNASSSYIVSKKIILFLSNNVLRKSLHPNRGLKKYSFSKQCDNSPSAIVFVIILLYKYLYLELVFLYSYAVFISHNTISISESDPNLLTAFSMQFKSSQSSQSKNNI